MSDREQGCLGNIADAIIVWLEDILVVRMRSIAAVAAHGKGRRRSPSRCRHVISAPGRNGLPALCIDNQVKSKKTG